MKQKRIKSSVPQDSIVRLGGLAGVCLLLALAMGCSLESVGKVPTDPVELQAALFHAARWEGAVRINALIDAGAKVNERDLGGWTPLHYAINRMRDKGYRDMGAIRSLIEKHGADVNAISNEGFSPVSLAAQIGAIEPLDLLVEHGVDPAYRDDSGFTLLMIAVDAKQIEMAEHLLQQGADVNHQLRRGGGALFIAIQRRSPETVGLLIKQGGDVGGTENYAAPIIFAASLRNEEVVKLLLEGGADVNAVSPSNGMTALHRAVESGPSMVRLLLEADANVNALNANADTPLSIAEQTENLEMIKLLSAGPL